MAMAAAEPAPAAVMTWARGSAALPAAHTPGTLVRPVRSVDREAGAVEVAPEAGEKVVGVRGDDRADEHRGSGDDLAVGELDTGEAVVLDDESGDFAVDDADASGGELGCLGHRWVPGVWAK